MTDTVQNEASMAPLTIYHAGETYEILPEDSPITIGRRFPAQVVVNDPRISRVHARIEVHEGQWHVRDHSSNGVFIDGVRHDDVVLTGDVTVHLGHPEEGIPVSFSFSPAVDGSAALATDETTSLPAAPATAPSVALAYPVDITTTIDGIDDGVARAGAAVAARRKELGISQRSLAADKIVNAGALIAFEKGRSWPRKSTREKLEDILHWPHGTIDRIRRGIELADLPPANNDPERTEAVTTNIVQAPLMAQAVELALSGLSAQLESIESMPPEAQHTAMSEMLIEIRNLETVAANAARTATRAPEVAMALSNVRKTYQKVMLRAARMPDATRGHKLYAARHNAALTPEEAANVVGVHADVVLAAEADQPLDPQSEVAIQSLLTWLTHR